MKDKIYTFIEQHRTGGKAKIIITRSQMLDFMRNCDFLRPVIKDMDDEAVINEFISLHQAKEELNEK